MGHHQVQQIPVRQTIQDLIVQNPGVPNESKYLQQARNWNIPIVNEAVIFFGIYPGKTIGITGTR